MPRLASILEAHRPMKSHPDASARSAAEVVTQLPVPSRLGMLRFERLNEPSWALLFLDPACERQLAACRTFPLAGRIAHRSWNLTV